MQYDDKVLNERDNVENLNVEQSIDINEAFFEQVLCYLKPDYSLLDIGTGNGYVLTQITQRESVQKGRLFGIDNSERMVKKAKQCLGNNAVITMADINNMPYDDHSFDIITAKNVTNINAREIFRVLKEGGVFVFREYGPGKGAIEIADMFGERIIRQREPIYYIELLTSAGFQIEMFKQYNIVRKYESARDLVSIINSFPFVENFSLEDEAVILNVFANNATITSDPFILIAKK